MLRRLMPLFFVFSLVPAVAAAHSVKWRNGTTYDYNVLLNGKDCCGGSECRPAFWYKNDSGDWVLLIPVDGVDPDLDPEHGVRVVVRKWQAVSRDLMGDGIAHACGTFDTNRTWHPYCTFIPPGSVSLRANPSG